MFGFVKIICSFIDPEKAKNMFTEGERVESEGFDEDIRNIDPNIDMTEYQEVMDSMD